jgi:hypothetical protein
MPRRCARWLAAIGLGLAICGSASPALADAARPGDTRSQVDALEPPADGVILDIIGGDAFLRLRVEPGHEVLVPGYQGEPYLRVLVDGTVQENRRSPASVINQDRYGDGADDLPVWQDGMEPDWRVIGTGGEVLWHDHRVHWMARTAPPTISPEGLVQRWEVPIVVDGVDVVVQGSLYRVDGPGVTWWLAALPAAGFGWWLVRRRPDDVRLLAATVAAAGVLTAVVHAAPWLGLPPIARSAPVVVLLGVLAAVFAAVAWAWPRPPYGAVLLAGAGSGLVLAAWAGRAVVTAGVVPGAEVLWPLRLTVVAAAGFGVAVTVRATAVVLGPPRAGTE